MPILFLLGLLSIACCISCEKNATADIFKIRILHINNLHARFDEVAIAGIKHMVDSIREENQPNNNTLFLHAADFFQVS